MKTHHLNYIERGVSLFVACWLLLNGLSAVSNVRFTHYTADDGLSQNRVMDIMQDQQGFMWFATWDGLNRFDGKNFRVYKGEPGDPNGFSNNRLNSIEEDAFGYLWISTNDFEVYRLNPRTEEFQKLSYSPDNNAEVVKHPVQRVEVINGDVVSLITAEGCYMIHINPDATLGRMRYLRRENGLLAGNDVRAIHKDEKGYTWFLTDRGVTHFDPVTGHRQHYFHQYQNETGFTCFLSLGDQLYLGSEKGQVWSWDETDSNFRVRSLKATAAITAITSLDNHRLLVTSAGDGLYLTDERLSVLQHMTVENYPALASNTIHSLHKDSRGNVWLEAHAMGVSYYEQATGRLYHFRPKSDEDIGLAQTQPNFFVVEDKAGRTWVHPRSGGFSEFNPVTRELIPFYNDPDDPNRRFFNTMHDAFIDSNGNLWMSTRAPGLEKCTFQQSNFSFFTQPSLVLTNNGCEVRTAFEDGKRRLWTADKEGKIMIKAADGTTLGFLMENGRLSHTPLKSGMIAYDIIQDRKNRIWLACKGKGLVVLTEKTEGVFTPYYINQELPIEHRPNTGNIYALLEDQEGRIWAGGYGGGLNLVLEEEGGFRCVHVGNGLSTYPFDRCRKIRDLAMDDKGLIWIATVNGIVAFDPHFRQPSDIHFYEYRKDGLNPNSLRTNDVHCIHIDNAGNRWFGTFGGGLNRLSATFQLEQVPLFKAYAQADGLPGDIVLSIEEDLQGYLWLIAENSITRFDPRSSYTDIYNKNYGLDPVTFSESSSCLMANGDICAGTMNGCYRFSPSTVKKATYVPPLFFTRFFLFNKLVTPQSEHSPLNKPLDEVEVIELKHNQDVFSIEFAALDYRAPENIQYAYRLEPIDKDWINSHKSNQISYTRLAPGEYTFRVRSTNSEGFWMANERSLRLIIKPSFWQTSWAILLYCVVGLLVFLGTLYFFITIYKLKSEVTIEQKVGDLKMRFFTEMSHELRTPLTLIAGPVEHVMQDKGLSQESRNNLSIVQRNIDRMMRLITQLLDFRKVHDNKMTLKVEETPIGTLTERIATNFEPTAQERGIRFNVFDQTQGVTVFLDRDKYDTIFYNLLSNAFKFTPGGKAVTVTLKNDDSEVVLLVEDEGKGISKERQNHLFERFFSYDDTSKIPGTGIGLNLVKELVELHGGTIGVTSEEGKGSNFEVRFKLGSSHLENKPVVIVQREQELPDVIEQQVVRAKSLEQPAQSEHQPLLLVVEDNVELRHFLTSILSKKYRVADAADGLAAWNMMGNLMPDFVISDMMMPVMDGLELTRHIRSDNRTCHIPVILLTAKSDPESKLESIQSGVDDFITKPFSAAYLEARIENIFLQRRLLQDKFRNDLFAAKAESVIPSGNLQSHDADFLKRIMDFMEENMSNSELTVEMLVSEAGMGRTVFFNKLKGLLGMSPIEFIKETRIKRAAELLETGKYNVSEVSFQIGMNDARYFSKCFKLKYGVTPSEYKNKTV